MSADPDISPKLEDLDPKTQGFIRALVAENKRLQAQVFKLQANNVSLQHRAELAEKNQKLPLIVHGATPSLPNNQ